MAELNDKLTTLRGVGPQRARTLEKLGLETLPPPLLEIARLRLNDPEATLYELGEMCSPPIGKSGVNNRLRRLSDMAKNLREGD